MAKMLLAIPPLRRELYSSEWPWMSVALDLKPPNVVIGNQSDPSGILIDTFRPQLWQKDALLLEALPSTHPAKRKLPDDELKTGDIRFQLGRLCGYFVAIVSRWHIDKYGDGDLAAIDSLRRDLATSMVAITKKLLHDQPHFEAIFSKLLLADLSEIEAESIADGTYEGSRYVQRVYE